MKFYKAYLLSLLAVFCMAPIRAMEAPPSPVSVNNAVNIPLLKNIENEIHATLKEMVATLRKIADGQSRKALDFNRSNQLAALANQLPAATINDLKNFLNIFTSHVQAFEAAFATASFDDLVAHAQNASKRAEEIKAHFKKAHALNALNKQMKAQNQEKQKKNVTFNDAQLEQVKEFKNTPEERAYRKLASKTKARSTTNNILITAGVSALLASGYAAFYYLLSCESANTTVAPEVAPTTPSSVEAAGFDVYRWLAGQSVNPYS